MTDPRLTGERLTLEEAVDIVEQWLAQQNIRFLGPAMSSIGQPGAGVLTNLSTKRCSQVAQPKCERHACACPVSGEDFGVF